MTKVYINGMACQHCVNRVKGALEELGLSNAVSYTHLQFNQIPS